MSTKELLKRVGFVAQNGPEPINKIEELERWIGVRLPSEYRSFLLEIGGGPLKDAVVPCTVPTPFGDHIITDLHGIQDVMGLLDSDKTPRNMVSIGFGHFGMTTCLSVAGVDHGQIYSLDTEMRFFWGEQTLSELPDLDQSVKEFFRMRDDGELPPRPWGYENCYHVADSFGEFLEKMRLA